MLLCLIGLGLGVWIHPGAGLVGIAGFLWLDLTLLSYEGKS